MILALALQAALSQAAAIRQKVEAAHLDVLRREYVTSFCPSTLLHPVGFRPPQAPDAYDQWVNYVAAHVRSGAPLGADYAALAQRAGAQVYNVWFDCAKHIHDLDELALRAEQTPEVVGRALWAAFAGSDAATRAQAADDILQQAYPPPP